MSKCYVIAIAIKFTAKVITISDYFMITAPVERLFSMDGKIFRPDLCRLTDQTFERLSFIKNNAGFCKIIMINLYTL